MSTRRKNANKLEFVNDVQNKLQQKKERKLKFSFFSEVFVSTVISIVLITIIPVSLSIFRPEPNLTESSDSLHYLENKPQLTIIK